MSVEHICENCEYWVHQGLGSKHTSGWCVSTTIAKSMEEFTEKSILLHCENIRTSMDDTFLITGSHYGCVHFTEKK